ncbi:hypothetical protein AOLI_G00078700 [Acnodon oligacanthus]
MKRAACGRADFDFDSVRRVCSGFNSVCLDDVLRALRSLLTSSSRRVADSYLLIPCSSFISIGGLSSLASSGKKREKDLSALMLGCVLPQSLSTCPVSSLQGDQLTITALFLIPRRVSKTSHSLRLLLRQDRHTSLPISQNSTKPIPNVQASIMTLSSCQETPHELAAKVGFKVAGALFEEEDTEKLGSGRTPVVRG